MKRIVSTILLAERNEQGTSSVPPYPIFLKNDLKSPPDLFFSVIYDKNEILNIFLQKSDFFHAKKFFGPLF